MKILHQGMILKVSSDIHRNLKKKRYIISYYIIYIGNVYVRQ